MATVTIASRVPNSPYLNQDFYIILGFGGSTFTNAFCTIASTVAPVKSTGSSYAAIFPAGSVATGTYAIYAGYYTAGGGSFANNVSIQIRASEIAEPVATIYSLIKNNLGTTYSSALVTTGWYSHTATYPIVTVTSERRSDEIGNLGDTYRNHEETLYVDTWVTSRDTGTTVFGTASRKRARRLLDDEVKRIINANRYAPSSKIRHMQIVSSAPLDEVTEGKKVFRTRHTVRLRWDETLS